MKVTFDQMRTAASDIFWFVILAKTCLLMQRGLVCLFTMYDYSRMEKR